VEQIVSLMNLPPLGGTWEDEEATGWQFPYTLDVCYNIPLDDSTTALGLFNSFSIDHSYVEQNPTCKPHSQPWHNVTGSNMRGFVGILILMGIIRLPHDSKCIAKRAYLK